MESAIDKVIRETAAIPLYDGAYRLWTYRRQYRNLEVPPTVSKPLPGQPVDWNTIQKVVRGVMDAAVHERTHAGNGAIFEILRAAHPGASDASLKAALQTAADFEGACTKNFKYTSRNLGQDADHAVAAARAEYPQFQEKTYQLASFRLATAMR
jgi:hypothetical protein